MVKLLQGDCLKLMQDIPDKSIDLVLTDIPYNEVNRKDNGLRKLDKGNADILTFDLLIFLEQLYDKAKSTIIIFCGTEQVSIIHSFFNNKQKKGMGSVRQLIWEKSNPSPMNGQHIYLSGVENAIWFKKRGGTFNAHCKNTVFKYPIGRSKLHPTEKNHLLLQELILDNSNENDLILDPCMGSGSTGVVALQNNRNFLGMELDEKYFNIAENTIYKQLNNIFN